jgi:hypothetical protein
LLRGDLQKAEEYAGESILQAVSIPYPHYTIMIGLANVEMALARENLDTALSLVDGLLVEVLPLTRSGIPDVLYNKARVLLGLERIEDARQVLMEAKSLAGKTGSNQPLWQILILLAELEDQLGHQKEAVSMRDEARQIINTIADRLQAVKLRQSFLEQAQPRDK